LLLNYKLPDNSIKYVFFCQVCYDCRCFAPSYISIAAAIAASVATKKKNEEAQNNPTFFEFETETEYIKFREDFKKAKEKYESSSGFKRMLKEVFFRKEFDLLQELTEEQIQQLYSAIRNCHNSDYSYKPTDKINLKNGKIIVTFIDGRYQDITDIVMPLIASIGKENDVSEVGLLEESNLEERTHGRK